ncbi:uncharacterized protein EI90DRAFT_3131898 [Cantharellus anzutake]|uniref:uncharacterized protein n=1 Tax=Cantharellus anzutake TaxID=1750568 RepID=UPI0019052851|nr:uncharacterized protein EI90DRAFT_3131898 [Cantharellus anzutake]KAF8320528.1 hypothetical protein EI90DRAFT_3131898 [Cantharellus anzutake]
MNDGDEHDEGTHADEASEPEEHPVVGEDVDGVPDGVHVESVDESEELADETEYFSGSANTATPDPEDDGKSEAVGSPESSPSTYKFDCSVCGKTLSGTRFLTTLHTGAQLICPGCEERLMTEHEKTVLPDYLRVLLKFTLPEVIEEESEEEMGQEVYNKLNHTLDAHMKVVDGRLEKLETRFGELETRFGGLEGKLEHVISFLESLRK